MDLKRDPNLGNYLNGWNRVFKGTSKRVQGLGFGTGVERTTLIARIGF